MHDARRGVGREHVVHGRERRHRRHQDTLAATVAPHVNASAFADGDAYVTVVQCGNVEHSSHLVRDLVAQLLVIEILRLYFFILCFSFFNFFIFSTRYHARVTGVRFVADAQLSVTVSAPDVEFSLISERQRVRVTADYFNWKSSGFTLRLLSEQLLVTKSEANCRKVKLPITIPNSEPIRHGFT